MKKEKAERTGTERVTWTCHAVRTDTNGTLLIYVE
jgi:hypothetical protein